MNKRAFYLLSFLLSVSIIANAASIKKESDTPDIAELCDGLDKAFVKRDWGANPCRGLKWKVDGSSVQGRPLMYYDFGPNDSKNTTLIFSMVHGNEATPLYVAFEIVAWAMDNMKAYPTARLVVVPLVNPDGFFDYPKTRTNAHGVDCNRNFATKDWNREALSSWKRKFHSEKSRFPGFKPDSEPETLFQKSMIEKFSPHKIISIHSPLNVIDYDGPDSLKLARFSEEYVKKCQELRNRVKAKSTGFFPGSLGNYAGQELGIPTITLELPTADITKAKEYWKNFKKGIVTVVTYEVPPKEKKTGAK